MHTHDTVIAEDKMERGGGGQSFSLNPFPILISHELFGMVQFIKRILENTSKKVTKN